uniref:Prolyl endopeptidase n=1 Tax=Omphalotus olearius TaxID=72120 RepID=UPI00209BBA94|nr:Chain AAA, Prolyl endopeptidase [Omphalotus olearius]7ZAZ_BBB Chain BBB, Prolyl endopeptidase [Omphalotus olearius]7ZAZ_CCC Chain CCC, Prolyl endopeptidase [Omphalotus olearius]7ZAZ_DDD Chain DDD, Prolyl endopeptidase [Omphalotus olearius]
MSFPGWGPYPPVERDETSAITYSSKLHGSVTVRDPYSQLEVPFEDSEETKAFVHSQRKFARTYLDENPDREAWLETLKKSWNYRRFSALKPESDGHYYFEYNDGLQSQLSLYRVRMGEEDTVLTESGPGGELFFNPNLLSLDGNAALTGFVMSPCGNYWAYGVSEHGSDWMSIYVRKTSSPHLPSQERGKDPGRMNDKIRHVRFFIVSWTSDSKGFFYSRYPPEDDEGKGNAPAMNCMVYYHRIGEDQESDVLVHEDPEHPFWISSVQLTPSGRYILFAASRDASHTQLVKIADLHENDIGTNMKWKNLHDPWEARFTIVGDEGSKIYFMTNLKAKNYKVATFDANHPDEGLTTLIAEDPNAFLVSASIHAQDKLLLVYLRNASHEIHIRDLTTGKPLGRIFEDLLGQFMVSGRRQDNDIFVLFSSFLSPGTVYRYTFGEEKGYRSLFRAISIPGLNLDDFMTESVFYPSKDGTSVHMFITRPKDVLLDGTSPVLQYGYGGFSLAMLPTFSLSTLLFCKIYRAIYAIPNIRGGSEYGESWHREGMLDKKQNVFDDFNAATEWLIANKYASKDRIAIRGGSNGGVLTTACANQAPGLYRCVITIEGIIDMLRFPKFTFGASWRSEYGDPEDPEDFDFIFKYSPYHNIPPPGDTVMPAMLFFTAAYDDRVSPLHTFKHVAALQHNFPKGPNPCLMRIDLNSGHFAGKSTQEMLEETADEYSFIGKSMGLTMQTQGSVDSSRWSCVTV